MSYADDFSIVCNNLDEVEQVFKEVKEALAQLGMTTEATKCKLLPIPYGKTA
jgi:hypothetical protein